LLYFSGEIINIWIYTLVLCILFFFFRQCSICHSVYPPKPLQLHSLAGDTYRQRRRHSRRWRFSPGARYGGSAHRTIRLVRAVVGQDRLQLRRIRHRNMHHRRLRRWTAVHRGRHSTSDSGGVHRRIRQ